MADRHFDTVSLKGVVRVSRMDTHLRLTLVTGTRPGHSGRRAFCCCGSNVGSVDSVSNVQWSREVLRHVQFRTPDGLCQEPRIAKWLFTIREDKYLWCFREVILSTQV